jgi:Uma2 family endonuclease
MPVEGRPHGTISFMSASLAKPIALAEFLAWEERQQLRYEFDGLQPIARTGGTAAHAFIQRNIAVALATRLRGGPCKFAGSNLKVEVAGRIRYPDGFVICTPIGNRDQVVRDPVVIFEVMSESTSRTDTVTKNREYAATPSVRRYVILAQDEIGGTMFVRSGETWLGHLLTPESILLMPEIGIEVPLAEFYVDVEFSPAPSTPSLLDQPPPR